MLQRSLQQRSLSQFPQLEAEITNPANAHYIDTPGHHLNIITRECCLGVYGDEWKVGMPLSVDLNTPRITACSVPSLIPNALHQASAGFFIRGEFLRVAHFGNSPECGYSPGDGRLQQRVEEDLPFLRNKQVLFRLTDVLPSDFFFLGARDSQAPRGSQYLLENRELLLEDISLAKGMIDGGASVTILVPNTSDPEEFRLIKEEIRTYLPDVKVGLMVETRESSQNLHKFKGSEAFFPGPSDLLAELLDVGRGEFHGNLNRETLMDAICADFLIGLSRMTDKPLIYTIKDMNRRFSVPEQVNRISIYTTPELYLSPESLARLLNSNSLS